MKKIEVLFVLSTLLSAIAFGPMDDKSPMGVHNERVENKNWKLKAGLYGDNDDNSVSFNYQPETYRLPNNTRPFYYDIFLWTDVDRKIFDFYGRVRIGIEAIETTNTVTLQYRDLEIEKVTLLDTVGNVIADNLEFEYVEPKQLEFLRITLPRFMQSNENFLLDIVYKGYLNTYQAGFYRANFFDGNDTVYYAVTQFQATDARSAFPCYDEPAIRTLFFLQIQHTKHYQAFSNSELVSVTPVEGTDYVISRFRYTLPMQTYILAFLVAPFEYVSNNDTRTPQRIIAKPSSIRNREADFALEHTGPILRTLEDHIGMNYSLSKLDHAAITQFAAGAMENWGLVTYREFALLFRSTGIPVLDETYKRRIITIMAHEDAHQFFGNLVSPHWWSDLWLNEGIATLYEYYIPHLLYPNEGFMEEMRISELARVFAIDVPTNPSSRPMSYYVESPYDIEMKFDDISYSKGGVVMRMFQEAFGVATFTKGLNIYLQKMSLKSATPNDLFMSIQDAVNMDNPMKAFDVEKIMGSWVNQAGYPVVTVWRNGLNLVFKQRRYPTGNGEIYSIPLSFATSQRPDFENTKPKLWLNDAEMEVPFDMLNITTDDWIIFNIQQTSLYRMSYSSELWYLIAAELRTNMEKIHPVNREVLVMELSIGFTNLEELLVSDVFEVLLYLVNEEQNNMWITADRILSILLFRFLGTDINDDFLEYLQFISRIQIKRLGFRDLDGEPWTTAELRSIVKHYNCFGLDSLCLDHEAKNLELFMQNNTVEVPDFCVAFRRVSMPTYLHFLNLVLTDPSNPHRFSILIGLPCSLDKSQLELLTVVVENTSNEFQNYERELIIQNMMQYSSIGLEVGLGYLTRNLEKISNLMYTLRLVINTEKHADKLSIILDDAVSGGYIHIEQARYVHEGVQENLKWQNKHYESAREWFENAGEKMTTTSMPTTTLSSKGTGIVRSFLVWMMGLVLIGIFG